MMPKAKKTAPKSVGRAASMRRRSSNKANDKRDVKAAIVRMDRHSITSRFFKQSPLYGRIDGDASLFAIGYAAGPNNTTGKGRADIDRKSGWWGYREARPGTTTSLLNPLHVLIHTTFDTIAPRGASGFSMVKADIDVISQYALYKQNVMDACASVRHHPRLRVERDPDKQGMSAMAKYANVFLGDVYTSQEELLDILRNMIRYRIKPIHVLVAGAHIYSKLAQALSLATALSCLQNAMPMTRTKMCIDPLSLSESPIAWEFNCIPIPVYFQKEKCVFIAAMSPTQGKRLRGEFRNMQLEVVSVTRDVRSWVLNTLV